MKKRTVDAYRVEVELEERVVPEKVRLDFPGTKGQANALEIYEIEIPKL